MTTLESSTETDTTGDLIGRLAAPSVTVRVARAAKPTLIAQAQAAHTALFRAPGRPEVPVRHALAARVAEQQGAPSLAMYHLDQPGAWDASESIRAALSRGDKPDDDAVRPLVRFLDIVSLAPALATPSDIAELSRHGYAEDDVILVAQLAAIVSFQAHLISGLQLVSGQASTPAAEPSPPATLPERRKYHPPTAPNGRPSPAGFTTDSLGWEPWVAPIPADELTGQQRAAFATKPNIPYFRLLARQPEILVARTDVDDAIFESGLDDARALPQAERELLAAVTSRVNDCVFCASVHARRAETLSGRAAEVRQLLAAPLERTAGWQPGDLSALALSTDDERWSALLDAGAALAATPPRATTGHLDRLRALGVTDAALVDAVSAVAFFSWANRLMLTLGEPFVPGRHSR